MAAELAPNYQARLHQLLENVRKQPYANTGAQEIYEGFLTSSFTTSRKVKDEVTRLFVEHLCGTKVGEPDWLNEVGRNSNGAGTTPFKLDIEGYWRKLGEMFPGILSPEKLQWLIETDRASDGAFYCFLALNAEEAPIENQSSLARNVKTYIQIWK